MDLQSLVEYGMFRGVVGLVRRLPPAGAEGFFRRLARLAGRGLRLRRGIVLAQLKTVFPHLDADGLAALADAVYDHLGLMVAEVFCADGDELVSRAVVEPGFAELDRTVAAGGGAILATGHIGNFELGGAILARRYRLLDVVKPQRNAAFDRYLERLRHARGIATVPMDRAGPAVLRHLRGGGVVSLLLDQDAGAQGWPTRFLGQPASTWPGVARFALRVGCPVFPVAMRRTAPGRHTLHIGRPLPPAGDAASAADVAAHLSGISAAVESFILAAPEQWFWVHRRWKGAHEARGGA